MGLPANADECGTLKVLEVRALLKSRWIRTAGALGNDFVERKHRLGALPRREGCKGNNIADQIAWAATVVIVGVVYIEDRLRLVVAGLQR